MVIGFARAKLCALYFDHCLPLVFDSGEYLHEERAQSSGANAAVSGSELLESLLLPGLWQKVNSSFDTMKEWAIVQETMRYWQEYQQTGRMPELAPGVQEAVRQWQEYQRTGQIEAVIGGAMATDGQKIETKAAFWMLDPSTAPIRAARYFLGKVGQAPLASSPALLSEQLLAMTQVGDVRIDQTRVELIDPARLSWRQILDFRKDKASARIVRQVCQVMFEETGSQTREDLEIRFSSVWQAHNAVCQKHGLAQRVGQLSILCGWASPMAKTAAANIAVLQGSEAPRDLRTLVNHNARIGNVLLSMVTHHIIGESRDLVYYLMDVESDGPTLGATDLCEARSSG